MRKDEKQGYKEAGASADPDHLPAYALPVEWPIYGMTDIKSSAEKTGRDIGQSAAENSSTALQQDAQRELGMLLEERGERIDMIFDNLGANVGMIADEMNEIQKHPERCPMGQVQEPQRSNARILAPQLQFAPGVVRNSPVLQREIALAANIQDWLLRLNASQDMVASVYSRSHTWGGLCLPVPDGGQCALPRQETRTRRCLLRGG